jgi:hypothetical protein
MNTQLQYTVRNVPKDIDQSLRRRALLQKKSFNQVLIDQLGLVNKVQDNFDWLFGSDILPDDFDQKLRAMRKPDPKDWR